MYVNPEIIESMHTQMLRPCVRVRTHKVGGSGTVLFSGKRADGRYHTLILTNHHVVDDAIQIIERWDSTLRKQIKIDERQPVQVEEFEYEYGSVLVSATGHSARIAAWDHMDRLDLALLEVDVFERPFQYVANLLPESEITRLRIFEQVYTIGSPSGHAPYPTDGVLTSLKENISGQLFWMMSSPIHFGSSGGSVYRQSESGNFHLIGMPSRVEVSGSMFSVSAVSHLGYMLPVLSVYDFLRKHNFDYVFDSSKTIEECEDERKKREEADKNLQLVRDQK